jgi:hypothetical protein
MFLNWIYNIINRFEVNKSNYLFSDEIIIFHTKILQKLFHII